MLMNPAVLALLLCSVLVLGMTAAAAISSLTVLSGWNPSDSGARQLRRERRALLVETSLEVALGFQLASFLFFLVVLERLHPLLTGAMCAAGSLGASRFGYPTLVVKTVAFLICGLWLLLNRASIAAVGTALVRVKYLFVFLVLGALSAESVLQFRYFADLDPEVLTSCCARIFGEEADGVGATLASLPVGPSKVAFFGVLALTLGVGFRSLFRRWAVWAFSGLSLVLGSLSMAAIVSWVGPGFYQLPTHHCPFCLLSSGYGVVGYPLYVALAVAVTAGLGTGLVHALRGIDPQRSIRPFEERRLALVSMCSFAVFSLIAIWPLVVAGMRSRGV